MVDDFVSYFTGKYYSTGFALKMNNVDDKKTHLPLACETRRLFYNKNI